MKLLAGLAVAASLASSAASAAVAYAPVYILSSSSSSRASASDPSSPPAVPRQVARQILLQRLAATAATSFFDTLPRGYDADAALGLLDQFGGDAADLFSAAAATAATTTTGRHPEMLIVVEGVEAQHAAAIEGVLSAAPAFTVADPPSQAANHKLFVDELARSGIVAHKDVALAEAVVPQTWANGVFVGLYDVKREPSVVDEIVKALPAIVALAKAGDADVTVVLMPEGSRASKASVWAKTKPVRHSAAPLELRAQESVFVEDGSAESSFDSETMFVKTASADDAEFDVNVNIDANADTDNTDSTPKPFAVAAGAGAAASAAAAAKGPIPACFQSFNSCVAQTNSCSGHGSCVDKFAANSGGLASQKGGACFVCHCVSTLNRPEDAPGGLSTTQWAGSTCSKVDVSIPFWLLTGFSVAMVGAVAFAIGLLFSVGEEKLPGVIGAGVSRSK